MPDSFKLLTSSILLFLIGIQVNAENNKKLLPPESLTAIDIPNDAGGSIGLMWEAFESDREGLKYIVSTGPSPKGPWTQSEPILSTTSYKSDFPQYFGLSESNKLWHFHEIPATTTTYFKLAITDDVNMVEFPAIVSATPKGNWFDTSKVNILICVIIFSGLILFFIRMARNNPNLFIRRIPGLDAIEETIGRATEMGKPILYLNGLHGMDSLSTIAATSILGKVARKVANYDSQIKIPCYDPIVMSVCQEVVKEAYIESGRPDAYKQDNIFFVTNDQFAYAAAVEGIMMRHKPAANLYMGYYYAEALLLAETGAATGAMQIAGTDSITQLPFFITTCDYTLIGEELYASSAYLSREPLQLGSLKGQDVSKALIILTLFAGSGLSTAGITFITNIFKTF